jgi:hypothetical protein
VVTATALDGTTPQTAGATRNTGYSSTIRSKSRWRSAVDRKEWAGAGCELEISAQDRGAMTGEVLHHGHVLALALQQNSMIVGAQVAHPVRLVAQHGHQVAVTLVGDDNYGKRDLPPGLAASNLDCGSLVWSDARCKGDAEQAA